MSDEEKRSAYGVCGGGGCGCSYNFSEDDFLLQVLVSLKGELIKVLTEADKVGVIVGRLVTLGRDYIAVSCEGTVAYILLCQVTAIIPID